MAEWSIAAVLKTVEGHTSGGSNPSLSAKALSNQGFCFFQRGEVLRTPRSSSRSAFAAQKEWLKPKESLSPPKQKSNPNRLLFLLTTNLTPVLGVRLVVLFYLG